MSFAVNSKHDETSARKFDCVLELHFAVVEISVREHDCGERIFGACVVWHEQDARNDLAFDRCFGFDGCAVFSYRRVCDASGVRFVSEIGHFYGESVRLNARRTEAAYENNKQTNDKKNKVDLILFAERRNTVFNVIHNFSPYIYFF